MQREKTDSQFFLLGVWFNFQWCLCFSVLLYIINKRSPEAAHLNRMNWRHVEQTPTRLLLKGL